MQYSYNTANTVYRILPVWSLEWRGRCKRLSVEQIGCDGTNVINIAWSSDAARQWLI